MTVVICPACDNESAVIFRCDECGHDLVDEDSSSGRFA